MTDSHLHEQLVYTTTDDGVRLEGVAIRPAGAAQSPAIVWVHDAATAFYFEPYIRAGRELAARGFPFLSVNTRGHDICAILWRSADEPPLGGGSGWELVEESSRDVAAWIRSATDAGAAGIVLAAHGAGAVKTVLYQADRQDQRVRGLVLASAELRSPLPQAIVNRAQRMVADGLGQDVVPAQSYAPYYRQSAHHVVSWARAQARAFGGDSGWPAVSLILCPVLTFYGSLEVAAHEGLETLRGLARNAPSVDTHLVDAADHGYAGQESTVARIVAEWIQTRIERAAGPTSGTQNAGRA